MSQTAQIAAYLKKGHKLTPIEALERFGCFRLAARVHELNRQGMNIKSELRRFNGEKRAAVYWVGR